LDLLQNAPQYINPALDREINLRANKIPVIENLGATQNHFDAINLSDNDLTRLNNMPPLSRLRALYVNNNNISRIAADFFEAIPELSSLMLSGNKLTDLVDLDPIFKCKNLVRLCMQDNPVTARSHYRYYVIFKAPLTLRFLDFQRIKDKERKAAQTLFSGERGEQLLADIAPPKKVVEDEPEAQGNEETIAAIKEAIANATSLEEVAKLEKALRTGEVPEDLILPGLTKKKDDEEGETKPDAAPEASKEKEAKPNGVADAAPEEPMDTA
jgi:U2 small nuclear ribonucleoprotein A'